MKQSAAPPPESDAPTTREEEAEALALARWLEGDGEALLRLPDEGDGAGEPPLAVTAGLLAVAAGAEPTLERMERAQAKAGLKPRRWAWAAAATGALAAGVALFFATWQAPAREWRGFAPPSAELLRAQAEATRGNTSGWNALVSSTDERRSAMFPALLEHYGGQANGVIE